MALPVCISTSSIGEFYSTFSMAMGVSGLLNTAHSYKCAMRWYLILVLLYISLIKEMMNIFSCVYLQYEYAV